MQVKDLQLKRALRSVLVILLLSTAGMMKGYAYNVIVGAVSNGTVIANPATANEGETVTLTATPNTDYALESWIVIDENDTRIPVTPDEGSYNVGTFTMPASNVTVTAQFETALTIDFEQEASAYEDWTFTSLNSQQSGEIVAYSGNYYGLAYGTSASIKTRHPIIHPLTLQCVISKPTQLTGSFFWTVAISNNGSSWSNIAYLNDSMLGAWNRVSVDLSTYTNIYVEVFYYRASPNGSDVGFIDDLQLTYDDEIVTPYFIFSAPDGYDPPAGWGLDPEAYRYYYYQCDDNWYYDGNSQNGDYGGCSANKKRALEGQTVTLTAYPLEHCRVNSWSVVKSGDVNTTVEVTPSLENPNQVTFIMPAFNVEFSATFTGDDRYHIIYTNPCIEHGVIECPQVAMEGEEITIHFGGIEDGFCLTSLDIINESTQELTSIVDPYNPTPFWMGDLTFTMPNSDVDVYPIISEYPYVYYSLVTDINDLVPGKHYIIVGVDEYFSFYYMDVQGQDNRASFTTYNMNGIIRPWQIGEYEFLFPHHEFVLSGSASDKWSIFDENEESKGYLYAASSEENQLRTSTILTDNALWDITIASNGEATIIAQGDNTHNVIRFASEDLADSFSCYASSDEQYPVYIYKKMAQDWDYDFYSNSTIESLELGENELDNMYPMYPPIGNLYQRCTVHSPAALTITGNIANNTQDYTDGYWDEVNQTWQEVYHSADENLFIESGGQLIANNEVWGVMQKHIAAYGITDGWNFIASPTIDYIIPSEDNGFINGTFGSGNNTYDLYYYDESGHQWINFESENGSFDIVPQQGYLYANSVDTDLSFNGTLQPSNEAISISEDNLSCSSDVLTGFNLVGNPFPCKATLNRSYYVIEGRTTVPCDASVAIDPCTGVMVQVTNDDKNVTFTRALPGSPASRPNGLQITVTQKAIIRDSSTNSTTMQDNAIVSFNKDSQLEKIVFNADAAKLYIPQGGKEYAIAVSEKQGEMPVNFHANENGDYALSVNPKGVTISYLHLIDNMTGADIDLLQTSTYTFSATTSDNESRFRIVFNADSIIEH